MKSKEEGPSQHHFGAGWGPLWGNLHKKGFLFCEKRLTEIFKDNKFKTK